MLEVTETEVGWLTSCTDCTWKLLQSRHVPTRHRCPTTGEQPIYMPPDWETRPREKRLASTKPPLSLESALTVMPQPQPTYMVGDELKETLESYGVTIDRWIGIKKKFGLPATCNCEARAEWLNKVSAEHPDFAKIGVELIQALRFARRRKKKT
jgi:predicted RNA-binding Zn-ribbon protein involved in translation (DUF1610 family)